MLIVVFRSLFLAKERPEKEGNLEKPVWTPSLELAETFQTMADAHRCLNGLLQTGEVRLARIMPRAEFD